MREGCEDAFCLCAPSRRVTHKKQVMKREVSCRSGYPHRGGTGRGQSPLLSPLPVATEKVLLNLMRGAAEKTLQGGGGPPAAWASVS